MRLRIRQPGKDPDRNCSICRGRENLFEFYDLDDDTLSFCLCYDCIKALYSTCADSCMFGYMFGNPKMASGDADRQSFKTGYREGYRDGFRDNYELHD
jgi:hypothetical protein